MDPKNPATQLEGLILDSTWTVGPLIEKPMGSTGGCFSHCYKVRTATGRAGFLKALDFTRAFNEDADFTDAIQSITAAFNFERDLLKICTDRRMDRVVRAISSGVAKVAEVPFGKVPYLIFEEADGDVRSHLDNNAPTTLAWKLRCLHHIATGLMQLHGADIAHQDVKPSNVLIFDAEQRHQISKIADLGRASQAGTVCPYDSLAWPGDPAYAPPEFHYGHLESDWNRRRIGADLYLLGNMVSFLFTQTTTISLLFRALPQEFLPSNWHGTYVEVLPYVQHAFSISLEDFTSELGNEKLREDLLPVFQQLCQPDPAMRGDTSRPMNKIALERFVSRFDMLARRAEAGKYSGD